YRLAEIFTDENKRFQGRLVSDVAAELGKSPFDTMMDIAVADDLRTSFMMDARGEDADGYGHRAEMWASDMTIVGASDAGAHMYMIDSFAFSTTLLQKSREFGLMPIEQVVRQLTSVPAQTMGITDRGVL